MDKQKGRGRFVAICLTPAVVLFIIFMVIPTVNVFRMSLFKTSAYSQDMEFVGLGNFSTLFGDMRFLRSFQNTVFLTVVVTIVTFGFALVFASILVREKIKGQNFFRVIFYIPNILSVVVIAAIFSAIYDPNQGLINSFLALFRPEGQTPILWLGDQKIVIYSIAIAMIWQAIGYYMVMYMASMSSVPVSLYECADLEGAGRVKQFFTITIPLVWTNIRTTLTFFIISSINISFLIVKAMTDGNPDGASSVVLSYMYRQAYTNSSYGYGMAIGVVIFLFSFALSAIVNFATKRDALEF